MKIKNLFAAAAAVGVAFAATPVMAQDFSGPRGEGRIGWGGTGISLIDTRDFSGRGDFSSGSNASDFSLGAEVGFDVQTGNLVFGAYAGADIAKVEEGFANGIRFETGRILSAGARVGYAVSKNVLLYGKGGYSNGELKKEFAPTANAAQFAGLSKNRDGYHFGGGVELAISNGVYTRFDYTHTRFEKFDVNATTELRYNRNQGTVALGARF